MLRTTLCSVAGAVIGFLAGVILIQIVNGMQRTDASDTVAVSVFVGAFLAGAGAIAGAVIGGVADLLAYLKQRARAADGSIMRP